MFAILKLYFHIISLVRNDRNCFYKENHCCLQDINNVDNVDCWQEIVIKEEKEEESYKDKILEELKNNNRNLKNEYNRLKEEKIKVDSDTNRNEKIEILIKYIKSKYNKNISKIIIENKR